jgi:hypothetical protein
MYSTPFDQNKVSEEVCICIRPRLSILTPREIIYVLQKQLPLQGASVAGLHHFVDLPLSLFLFFRHVFAAAPAFSLF